MIQDSLPSPKKPSMLSLIDESCSL